MKKNNWNDNYIAIIGDMKNSRNLNYRNEIQDQLSRVLEKINVKYQAQIASKFVITLGDEFQGLLTGGKFVTNIIEEIKMDMHPVHIRFGIGVGNLFTRIDEERALGADGPAYYCAREAISFLKESEKKKKTPTADVRIKFDMEKEKNQSLYVEETLINTVFELIYAVESDWTEKQRKAIWDMQKYNEGQQGVANRLNIGQSTLNKALTAGHYYTYAKAMRDVDKVLGEIRW